MRQNVNHYVRETDTFEEKCELNNERSVGIQNPEVLNLFSIPLRELKAMRMKSFQREREALDVLNDAFHSWEEKAADMKRLDAAIRYIEWPKLVHTSNEWWENPCRAGDDAERIANKVYTMYVSISYARKKDAWEAEWTVWTNAQTNHDIKIAGQKRMFPDKKSAEKYIRGRKKAYSHLFQELYPPIPDEYVEAFKVCGQLLPGYTTESMVREREDVI